MYWTVSMSWSSLMMNTMFGWAAEGTARSSRASTRGRLRAAGRGRLAVAPRCQTDFRLRSQRVQDMVGSPFPDWSAIQWRDIDPGAQTERRGGAGPVGGLLGG